MSLLIYILVCVLTLVIAELYVILSLNYILNLIWIICFPALWQFFLILMNTFKIITYIFAGQKWTIHLQDIWFRKCITWEFFFTINNSSQPEAHFTKDFCLQLKLMKTSSWCNFTAGPQMSTIFYTSHDSTTVVPCTKFVAINLLEFWWEWNEFSIKFILRWKNIQRNGPHIEWNFNCEETYSLNNEIARLISGNLISCNGVTPQFSLYKICHGNQCCVLIAAVSSNFSAWCQNNNANILDCRRKMEKLPQLRERIYCYSGQWIMPQEWRY